VLPEIVYVPGHPDPRPGHHGVRFETRHDAAGEPVGVAFGSRGQLATALGPDQPWVAMRLSHLEVLLGAAGIRRILVDPHVDPSARRWDAVDLAAMTRIIEEKARG
jgi:hypothetical protein